LTAVALVAALVLAPAALAKQHKDDASATASATASADDMTASPTASGTASPTAMASGSPTAAVGGALPATGGSGFALLAGALLLGSGVLSYAILRRSP
jgi:hypothetical protein